MLNNNFPFVPEKVSAEPTFLRLLMKAANRALAGKLNCTGQQTLTASVTSTPVADTRCLANSVVLLQPTTSNAAAALGTTYIVAADGSFIIHHASNSQTDRTFNYAILG